MRQADLTLPAVGQTNPPAKSEVKPMATNKVQVQMWKKKVYQRSVWYTAMGRSGLEVCTGINIKDQAFEKLGSPDEITVTIEAVSLQADVSP
ncbi:hypothetical protein ES705_15945 [subsurface metagenome]